MLAGQADPFGYRTAGRCLLKGKRTPRPGPAGVAPRCARPTCAHREKLDSIVQVRHGIRSTMQADYHRHVNESFSNRGDSWPGHQHTHTSVSQSRTRQCTSTTPCIKWNSGAGNRKQFNSLATLQWIKLWVLPESINTVTFFFLICPSILRVWGVVILDNALHDMVRLISSSSRVGSWCISSSFEVSCSFSFSSLQSM